MPEEPPKVIENRQLTQLGINRAFWKLLASHGGGITIAASELVNLPVNAALQADYDAALDSFTIKSVVRQPKGIIAPNTGLITG